MLSLLMPGVGAAKGILFLYKEPQALLSCEPLSRVSKAPHPTFLFFFLKAESIILMKRNTTLETVTSQ